MLVRARAILRLQPIADAVFINIMSFSGDLDGPISIVAFGGRLPQQQFVVRRPLRRSQVKAFFEALALCLIGMEACATSHYWARELTKLGHEVRLMPAKDVKADVKR
jgi:transposase